jgi:hypothetical protein
MRPGKLTTQAEGVRELIMSQIPCEIVSGDMMTIGTAGRLMKSYGFAVYEHDGYLWGRVVPEDCTNLPFDPVDPEWSRVAKVVPRDSLYPAWLVSVEAVDRWLGF